MSYTPPPQLLNILEALLEGTLTQCQREQLASILSTSQDAQRFFVEYLGLHATIQWQALELFEGVDSSTYASTEPMLVCQLPPEDDVAAPTNLRSWLGWSFAGLSLACSLLLAFRLLAPDHLPDLARQVVVSDEPQASRQPDDAVAAFAGVMRQSNSAQWAEGSRTSHTGRLLRSGDYDLLSGVVVIDLFGGGIISATGPAKFTLNDGQSLTINSGNIKVSVPDENANLTVNTPAADLVHIGTEFVVSVGPDGTSDVVVLDGAIEVHPRLRENASKTSQLIRADNGFRISPDGRYEALSEDLESLRRNSYQVGSLQLTPIAVPTISPEGFEVRYVKVSPDENVALLELSLADALLDGRFATIEDVTTPSVPALDFEERGHVPGAENLFPLDADFPGDSEGSVDMDDGFAIRATATMIVAQPWIYSFLTNADDGVRLRIDGRDVIVDDGYHRPTISIGSIPLESGEHTVEVTYYDLHRGARLELGVAAGQCRDSSKFVLLSSTQNPAP